MFPASHVKQRDLQLIMFFSNGAILIVFTFLVLLLKEKGIDELQIGVLASSFSLSLILSNTIFGRLSDIMGRRLFIVLGLGLAAVSTVFYIIPNSFEIFLVIRVFNGIAFGMYPSSIVGVASDRRIGLGSLSSWGSLGWGVGALIGGFLSEIYSLNTAFILGFAFFTVAFFIALLTKTGRSEKNIEQVNKNENNINPVLTDITEPTTSKTFSSKQAYVKAFRLNWKVYLVYLLRHGSANSIWIYWALFLKLTLNLNNFQIGLVQMTNMLTQFTFMKSFTDKFNPKKMFLSGAFISALAFYTFTLCTSFIQIILAQIILGISWAFFYVGALRSIELNSRHDNIVATATGLFNATNSLAQLIGPFLAILIFSVYQTYTATMRVASVVTVFAGLLYASFYLFRGFSFHSP